MNAFFHSVFIPSDIERPASFPTLSETLDNQLSKIELIEEVAEVLKNLDPNKAIEPDGIPCRLIVERSRARDRSLLVQSVQPLPFPGCSAN